MHPEYDEAAAEQMAARFGPSWGVDLAHRVYTSRLLGSDPSLVLHGGGNTSVKSTATEITGEPVEVLFVKGSGADLATIGPEGFPACRLAPLQRMARLPSLSDQRMVAGLRSQMLDPGSPTPSVEALLHAILPGKFVDHTHADAVLTVQDQPDAADLATAIWGPEFLFIPYVMPGFLLTRRVAELGGSFAGLRGLVLEQHGIFTWGATARESYDRMIAAVRAAEDWRTAQRPAAPLGTGPADLAGRRIGQARLAPILRGVLARHAEGRHFVAAWRDEDAIMALTARADGPALTERGTVTPDHVIRTRPRPLWLEAVDPSADDEALRTRAEAALARHVAWYDGYFRRGQAAAGGALRRLDPLPRLLLVPGCGALTIGRTMADARIVGDIAARASAVIVNAEAVGRYHPVPEADLFEVEYWSLEQAKLAKGGAEGPLAGRIAFITGGAIPGGIGRATAEHFLALGAHVMVTDLPGAPLEGLAADLSGRFGPGAATHPCDVSDDASVRAAIGAAVSTFGGLDIVVSNAGSAPTGYLHQEAGDRALGHSIEVNLLGHQRVAREAAAVMLRQAVGGCLLFNASKSAVAPGPDFGPYAVAKAGLLALMRQYAIDLAPHGIRANAVNADRVRTSLFSGGVLEARATARGLAPDEYFRQNLLGRETTAEDVARAFGWLATAPATTGCYLPVDGGNPAAFPR
jgi:rhamnose utilization protein RhaD (predicted bifunctional aldolase and dehydrogenase)/NAD(P)-dependent dehydrogenase (short-subunit alcohol dehydrogenase family)